MAGSVACKAALPAISLFSPVIANHHWLRKAHPKAAAAKLSSQEENPL
jgi:hypothetical protein